MNQSNRWPFRPTWGRFVLSLVLPPLLAILLMPGTSMGDSASMRQASSDSAALREGVVLSPRHGFAYVMRPGGLAAVNLANGKVRWRSDKGAKPVALLGDRLIAQADSKGGKALELVALDARSGAVRESVRIPLPAGVAATLVDTAKGSFRVQVSSVGSELMVRWEATGTDAPLQGYLPYAEDGHQPEAASVVAGEAALDVASLAVKAEPTVRVTRSAAIARAALEELSAPAVTGAPGRQMLSADGRHVLVTEPVDAADFTLNRHRWTLYERASGTRLGSVPAMVSAAPFVVVGNTLYHTVPAHAVRQDGKFVENPASLRAVSLKGGAEAWKMALLETDFRGPFPP